MDEIIIKAGKIISSRNGQNATEESEPYCVLALIDENGFPTASTLTASKSDGIKTIHFCTGLDSNKVNRIKKCNRASVCFTGIDYNITLVGTIETITDPAVKKEMWYKGLEAVFQGGMDDPQYCVLRFKTERYNLLIDWKLVTGKL